MIFAALSSHIPPTSPLAALRHHRMNPIMNFERSAREYIILSLSLATILSMLPFVIHRIITRDWPIAALDGIAVIAVSIMFVYVYKTHKTKTAGLILALIFLAVEIATVSIKGQSQFIWCFPATVGIYFLVEVPRATIINSICLLALVLITHNSIEPTMLAAFVLSMIATNVFIIVFALRNETQKRQLEELTQRDPLTGVHNHRAFENFLQNFELSDIQTEREKSMIMLTIDNLNAVKDGHGYLAGDETLVRMVTLIKTQLHHDEKLFRVGGDEWVVAPLNMDLAACYGFADRLRKIIEHSSINGVLAITVSIGVSQYEKGESVHAWMKRADDALREAKSDGANQTRAISI